jgi:hypothetical protein
MAATSNNHDVACTHCPVVERLLNEITDLEDALAETGFQNLLSEASDEFLIAYA